MKMGRGRKSGTKKSDEATDSTAATRVEEAGGREVAADAELDDADLREVIEDVEEQTDGDDDASDDADDADAELDWRHDGPFDFEEVDLSDDGVPRIDLGTLILTPWDGLNLQLQVDEQTQKVLAVVGVWGESGLEVAIFAAPSSAGLADSMREEAAAEAVAAGGTADVVVGEFGDELRRTIPQRGPKNEQLYHVSSVWYAEGPRWLLRGTLLGEAALTPDDLAVAAPFLEFFRNLVVRRGDSPMVPGEQILMELPEGAA